MNRTPDLDLSDLLGPPAPPGISEAELSDLLGINSSRLRTLVRDGVVPKLARGRYDRREAVRAYCANLREQAGRAGRPAAADGDALKVEKLRLTREQADTAALKNAQARGETLQEADVVRAWSGILRDVRAAQLAVASRVGAALPHLTAHDIATVDQEIKAALEALSNEH